MQKSIALDRAKRILEEAGFTVEEAPEHVELSKGQHQWNIIDEGGL